MTDIRKTLTAESLRSMIDYDPLTGHFVWRHRPDYPRKWNTRYSGKRAGVVGGRGYVYIVIERTHFLAHRLAWFYVHGTWPAATVDHVNGDKIDNRLANLREASPAQNQWNQATSRVNKSGFKGVSLHNSGMWRARIRANGRTHLLGYFHSPETAHQAYCDAARKHHGDFARTA